MNIKDLWKKVDSFYDSISSKELKDRVNSIQEDDHIYQTFQSLYTAFEELQSFDSYGNDEVYTSSHYLEINYELSGTPLVVQSEYSFFKNYDCENSFSQISLDQLRSQNEFLYLNEDEECPTAA